MAQCGGGRNLRRIHDRLDRLRADEEFAAWFTAWRDPWEFADAETTARRLTAAGFHQIRTSLESTPVVFPDAPAFAAFITNVICRPYLARLPDAERRDRLIARVTEQAAGDVPAFELDYWRLNLEARRSA